MLLNGRRDGERLGSACAVSGFVGLSVKAVRRRKAGDHRVGVMIKGLSQGARTYYKSWVDSRVTLIRGTGSLVSEVAKIRYRVDAADAQVSKPTTTRQPKQL